MSVNNYVLAAMENCFIYACITTIILGCYRMGFGGVGWWSLSLVLCVNYIRKPEK